MSSHESLAFEFTSGGNMSLDATGWVGNLEETKAPSYLLGPTQHVHMFAGVRDEHGAPFMPFSGLSKEHPPLSSVWGGMWHLSWDCGVKTGRDTRPRTTEQASRLHKSGICFPLYSWPLVHSSSTLQGMLSLPVFLFRTIDAMLWTREQGSMAILNQGQ